MAEILRVPPEKAREKVTSGSALLVCAYADDEKFKKNHLEGGISLNDFKSRLSGLSKEQEIIFYCA
jgi:hypothetical protein